MLSSFGVLMSSPFVGVLLFLTFRNWGAISDRQCYPFIFILVDQRIYCGAETYVSLFLVFDNFLVANKNLRKIYL